MAGLPKADELLEVARHELAAPVGDDLRPGLGVSLAAPLQDDLRVSLLHGGANIPTDNVTRAAIQHTAQIVKGRCDVDEREVDMPMLMGRQWLHEAFAFARGSTKAILEQTGGFEHPVHRRWTDRHQIAIQHHERQAPVTLQRILVEKADNGLPLPSFNLVIARHQGVVLIELAKALLPAPELARGKLDPFQKPARRQFGQRRPVMDKVYHRVANIVGHPDHGQLSPSSFFRRTISSTTTANTSSLRLSLLSIASMAYVCRVALRAPCRPSNAAAAFSKSAFCHW